MLKHACAIIGLLLATCPVLPGVDGPSPMGRIIGHGSGGFNSGSLDDYEVGDDVAFAPESDGDSDLGEQFLLRRQPKKDPVTGSFYSDLFWSNNLTSASSHEIEGFFWSNTIEAIWRPRIAENLFLDTLVGQDVFIYESGVLNFESTRAALGLIRTMPDFGNLALSARYEFAYTHVNNPSFPIFSLNDHLKDHVHRIHLRANRPVITLQKDSAFVALDANFDLEADPRSLAAFEYAALLGYTHRFTDQLRLSAFYRLAWADYRNTDRNDWNQLVGVELAYALSEAVRFHTSLLYVRNDSDTALGIDDYETFQGGFGFGVTAKF